MIGYYGWYKMKKILIVDDDPIQLFTLKELFKEFGSEYEATFVDNGKKCLEFLENNPNPDLILLDIMMPEMDGWEVLEKIRQNSIWNDISVVFLTAINWDETEKYDRLCVSDHIEKPYDNNEFKKRIDIVLKKK